MEHNMIKQQRLTKHGVRDLGNDTRRYLSRRECAHVWEITRKRHPGLQDSITRTCIACGMHEVQRPPRDQQLELDEALL